MASVGISVEDVLSQVVKRNEYSHVEPFSVGINASVRLSTCIQNITGQAERNIIFW